MAMTDYLTFLLAFMIHRLEMYASNIYPIHSILFINTKGNSSLPWAARLLIQPTETRIFDKNSVYTMKTVRKLSTAT